jgi:GGDEF domain-containing protein
MQRVMAAISQAFVIDEREFKITCSAGIASFPRDGEDADTLLRNADTAMFWPSIRTMRRSCAPSLRSLTS